MLVIVPPSRNAAVALLAASIDPRPVTVAVMFLVTTVAVCAGANSAAGAGAKAMELTTIAAAAIAPTVPAMIHFFFFVMLQTVRRDDKCEISVTYLAHSLPIDTGHMHTVSDTGIPSVLVVDDEPSLRQLLSAVLRQQGWDVRTAHNGQAAIDAARARAPHLIVLDVVLPDIDGLSVLAEIRAFLPTVLVLFLTANDSVHDRVAGITAGGDDYVTKPFSVEEVVARLRGMLRRSALDSTVPDPLIVVGDLTLNEDSHRVTRGGTEIVLTATEFDLLRFLMINHDRVLSKHHILDRVWQYDFGNESNIVEIYISYLRKKIDTGREPMIHTLRRVGYVLRTVGQQSP